METISTITSEDSEFFIKRGLTDSQIDQLINYAQTDPALNMTSDKERFKDRQSFDEFSSHILQYYSLTDSEGNLLGIIWWDNLEILGPVISSDFSERSQDLQGESRDSSPPAQNDRGSENPSDYGISFAIRLYGKARGKGLSQEFTEKVLEDFKTTEIYKNHPHNKIWLAVSPENEPAVNLYRKLGFKDLKIEEEHGKLLMIME